MSETQLEWIEDETSLPEIWNIEIEKKLMTISPETITKLEEAENKGIVIYINPRELRLSKLNPRQEIYETEELKRLKENISLNRKVNQPLLVRLNHAAGEIVGGGLRWRISLLLDFEKVPVLVKSLSDEEALAEIESEDTGVPLDPVSRGLWYAQLLKRYGSLREVGRILKVSYETVSNYLTIGTPPDNREDKTWQQIKGNDTVQHELGVCLRDLDKN